MIKNDPVWPFWNNSGKSPLNSRGFFFFFFFFNFPIIAYEREIQNGRQAEEDTNFPGSGGEVTSRICFE